MRKLLLAAAFGFLLRRDARRSGPRSGGGDARAVPAAGRGRGAALRRPSRPREPRDRPGPNAAAEDRRPARAPAESGAGADLLPFGRSRRDGHRVRRIFCPGARARRDGHGLRRSARHRRGPFPRLPAAARIGRQSGKLSEGAVRSAECARLPRPARFGVRSQPLRHRRLDRGSRRGPARARLWPHQPQRRLVRHLCGAALYPALRPPCPGGLSAEPGHSRQPHAALHAARRPGGARAAVRPLRGRCRLPRGSSALPRRLRRRFGAAAARAGRSRHPASRDRRANDGAVDRGGLRRCGARVPLPQRDGAAASPPHRAGRRRRLWRLRRRRRARGARFLRRRPDGRRPGGHLQRIRQSDQRRGRRPGRGGQLPRPVPDRRAAGRLRRYGRGPCGRATISRRSAPTCPLCW